MKRLFLLALFARLMCAQDPAPVTPWLVIDTRNGQAVPCVACNIYSYAAGTTNPLAVYTDSGLGTANTNPVPTNSSGYAVNGNSPSTITGIWIGTSCYKFILKDANAVTIWTQDNICDASQIFKALLATSAGAGYIGYNGAGGSGGGPLTVAGALNAALLNTPWLWGAACDGSTDDTAAAAAWLAHSKSASIPAYLGGGFYGQGGCNLRVNTATAGIILNIANGSLGLTIIGPGSGLSTISTTNTSADLMSTGDVTTTEPVYRLSGFSLVGPDAQSTPCSGSSGNGLLINGSAGAPRPILSDINVLGFCGSGKAGVTILNAENWSWRDGKATYNMVGLNLDGTVAAVNTGEIGNLTVNLNNTGIGCAGGANITYNALTVESNVYNGMAMSANCGNNTFNSPTFEANNTSATPGDYGLVITSSSGNTFNSPSFSGTGESIFITATSMTASFGNIFVGGRSNATVTLYEDSSYTYDNAFIGLIAQLSQITYSNGAALGVDFICPLLFPLDGTGSQPGCVMPRGGLIAPTPINLIATENGMNDAIAGCGSYALTTNMQMTIVLAHTLQAGANTFAYCSGSATAIKEHTNPGSNLSTAYVSGARIQLLWDGSVFEDLSQ